MPRRPARGVRPLFQRQEEALLQRVFRAAPPVVVRRVAGRVAVTGAVPVLNAHPVVRPPARALVLPKRHHERVPPAGALPL